MSLTGSRVAIVAAAILFVTFTLTAQTNRGGIAGTVFDPQGAIVPGANVTIVNLGTNQVTKAKTSSAGAYTVLNLDPVSYSVAVEVSGFKKEVVDNVKVDTASVATVNLTLQTGATSSTITVQASSAMINTESGTTGTTVTEREIQDVPLFNRSVLDLAVVQPNVSGDAGSENPGLSANATVPGYNLSVNGGRPGSTNFLADGVNNTGVSFTRTMVSFTPETVQEFSIQTSAYSAEYGNTGGGIINATTKSGTNQLNGTVLWYNRNPAFAAAPFTQAAVNRPPATQKDNQFSLAAGGPVYLPKIYDGRNKTFWFGAWEPHYRRDSLAQDALQPTPGMLTGDFSNLVNTTNGLVPTDIAQKFNQSFTPLAIYNQYNVVNGNQFTQGVLPAATTGNPNPSYAPFPNNVIPPSMLDSTFLKSVKYIPSSSAYYIGSNGSLYNLSNPRLLSIDETRYTVKIDQIFNANHHLSGRYSVTPIVKTQYQPTDPTGNGAQYSYAKQAMLDHTWIVTPAVVNDLRLNYTRGKFSITFAQPYDPLTGTQNLNTLVGLPNILKGGLPSLPYIGGQGSTDNNDVEERYAISNITRITHGSMTISLGVDVSHALQNVVPLYGASGGIYSFSNNQSNSNASGSGSGGNTFASFALGIPSGITLRSTLIPYYYRWNSGAGFIQDDWKVRPNLTLNLGLRYSLQLPRTEKYDHQGALLPDLAQSYPLASPMTLADGTTVSSVRVPPFGFVGKGGRSRYLYPADYTDFEPRFGFAWSPGFLRERRVTIRGGYGLSHAPVSGANRLPAPDFGGTTSAYSPTSGQLNPNYLLRLGENGPLINSQTPDQAIFGTLGVPSNGLVTLSSLYFQQSDGAFAVSNNVHTPYVQNWNFTLSWQAGSSTSVELSYVGNKGTHLFMPRENIDPKSFSLISAQDAANVNTTNTINDPLGRLNPITGKVLTVQNGSLGSPYLGFSSITELFDASANSIRHAAYINVVHRAKGGLTFTSNYTFGKSIDDASDGGVEKNVQTVGRVDGQVALGGTRKGDRSVSLYDQKHVIAGTAIYDLPFGRGRRFLSNAWAPLDYAVGGWTASAVVRLTSGVPATATIGDANQLGDLTHTVRPDLVAGQPLVNPLYDRNCPLGSGCQPYLNPSAFEHPVLGQLGNAPRSFDGARGPWNQFYDQSIQKNFRLGESSKRRLQFRVDFLNAFNHPNFRVFLNNAGGTDVFGNTLNTGALTAADYNSWAIANNQPQSKVAGDAGTLQLNQINAMVNGVKVGGVNGALPANFLTVPLPKNFYGTQATAYNITTLDGFKLFRLRQGYNTSFGDLYNFGLPRYIQFGLKLYF
jgi:Carboxypeptidase regulatory-like domain